MKATKVHISNTGTHEAVCGSQYTATEIGPRKYVATTHGECLPCLKIGVTLYSWKLVDADRTRQLTAEETAKLLKI